MIAWSSGWEFPLPCTAWAAAHSKWLHASFPAGWVVLAAAVFVMSAMSLAFSDSQSFQHRFRFVPGFDHPSQGCVKLLDGVLLEAQALPVGLGSVQQRLELHWSRLQ